eukprot:scaffold137_cov398-Prasinococcus_capsulatus_cf.AAC.46
MVLKGGGNVRLLRQKAGAGAVLLCPPTCALFGVILSKPRAELLRLSWCPWDDMDGPQWPSQAPVRSTPKASPSRRSDQHNERRPPRLYPLSRLVAGSSLATALRCATSVAHHTLGHCSTASQHSAGAILIYIQHRPERWALGAGGREQRSSSTQGVELSSRAARPHARQDHHWPPPA